MKIILDTDIDTDCDDAGALAVMHTLIARRQAELLGVVCSIPECWCAPCVQAINTWYGRPEIPVGQLRLADWRTNPAYADYQMHRNVATAQGKKPLYNEVIGRPWLDTANPGQPQDAVTLYRQLLAAQEDGSVTICAIGTLSALAQLLASAPDGVSPLDGRRLVARKVSRLVTMALGEYPQSRDVFNWLMDRPAAHAVLTQWPTAIRVSYYGETVLTGANFMATAAPAHPVATAYRVWLGSTQANRPSWDQLTVLCAANLTEGLFREETHLRLTYQPDTGAHTWQAASNSDHGYYHPIVDDQTLARFVEGFMVGDD